MLLCNFIDERHCTDMREAAKQLNKKIIELRFTHYCTDLRQKRFWKLLQDVIIRIIISKSFCERNCFNLAMNLR